MINFLSSLLRYSSLFHFPLYQLVASLDVEFREFRLSVLSHPSFGYEFISSASFAAEEKSAANHALKAAFVPSLPLTLGTWCTVVSPGVFPMDVCLLVSVLIMFPQLSWVHMCVRVCISMCISIFPFFWKTVNHFPFSHPLYLVSVVTIESTMSSGLLKKMLCFLILPPIIDCTGYMLLCNK